MVAKFYKDCEIFITGGSGVVGKAAIEKLLRSCDVKTIYILLRGKRGLKDEQRLQKIKNSKIFRVLNSTKPNELDKLVAIPGDVMLPNLGITPKYAKMMENVSVVFHCAATIRFDESLKIAIALNVGGTYEALKFSETLKKLKVFMHVSTFFSNPYLKVIEPKLYTSPMDWKFCLDLVKNDRFDRNDILDVITRKLIVGFPNTYCFTKNLSESVVDSFRGRLPVVIYRPSIVVTAVSEPEPGFPPGLMGITGLTMGIAAGVVKTVYMKRGMWMDVVPQDLCTKVMLVGAVLSAEKYKTGNVVDIPVYLASSCGSCHHPLSEISERVQEKNIYEEFAFEKNLLIPWCYMTSSRVLYKLLCFTHQIIPAMLVDSLLMLFGRPPMLMQIIRKGYVTIETVKPFLFNSYESPGFTDELFTLTEGTDFKIKEEVEFYGTDEGILQGSRNLVAKIRELFMNEDPSTIPRAQKILRVKKIIYNVIRAALAYYLLRWIYKDMLYNYVY